MTELDFAGIASRVDPLYGTENVKADLIWFIEDAIRNRPRSQQRAIGPSEIGHECGRWVAYKLADTEILNDFARNRDGWRTQVGTWVHEGLADVFASANDPATPMFVVEHSLPVGVLTPIGDGEAIDVYGSGDLWYQGVAIDWKIVGPSTLKKATTISRATRREHGPSIRYRKQIATYGKGWQRLGLPVHHVMIAMLPAAGDLRKDAYWWSEPFDPSLADEAFVRLNGTNKLLHSGLPFEDVLRALPTADAYCTSCPYFVANSERLADGCPGGPKTSTRQDALFSLAPPN